jgi:putative heme-binding domain-containing protein
VAKENYMTRQFNLAVARSNTLRILVAVSIFGFATSSPRLTVAVEPALQLQPGDHIAYIGNTLADRMQHHGWLETQIHAMHPDHDLTFRNLGFPGDEIKSRPRSANFGSPDEWLTKAKADVIFCFFGYNEALRGEPGLIGFAKDLSEMIEAMKKQKYNGKSAPRLVIFSPIAHENLNIHYLPDGVENNAKLELYTNAMRKVCAVKDVPFVDLFHETQRLYEAAETPLTMNGIHLLSNGNFSIVSYVVRELFLHEDIGANISPRKLRDAVLDKNLHWFSRYRVVDGYNVYGGRSTLNWHGQSNADVMRREMEIFDIKTANRDKLIWAVAKGRDYKVTDDNLPVEIIVKTNKPGILEGGKHIYFGPVEAIEKMTVHKDMEVNLFASEEMFPEMVNPVQMAVDTDGRLFVSVWPSYPHWNPTQPRTDRIVCLPDEDGDGIADKCVIFADELNSITGFEFWGGGMLVAAPPEIWFLKDTDGDDKADVKIRMLQGLSSADTHHTANGLVIGTDGCLYWSRGVFHVTNMETPTKTFRSKSSGVYRFDPRTFEINFHFPIGPNPHGDVIDQWGYQFVNDGTSGTGSHANIGKGVGNKQWFQKQWRPVSATGILSSEHFPENTNGNFLICNTIGFLGVLQHEVHYNGAEITAKAIDPILFSSDPNFRPTDIEIGGDGAIYISDWSNVLIGHMQHNMRDPNRDHAHGRIYRVTSKGRPLTKLVKLKGKPVETVLEAFYSKTNSVRYRARLELSGRPTEEVMVTVSRWAAKHDPKDANDAQALLECLWVFEEHRVPNLQLLTTVFSAEEPRVRAAAIRTLGHWSTRISEWAPILVAAARDDSALVRAEAVKAAVSFPGLDAAEVIFEVATRQTDPELDTVLNYARRQMNVDAIVQDSIKSGRKLSTAAQSYVLRNASVKDLLRLDPTEAVYLALLSRTNVPIKNVRDSIRGLATIRKSNPINLILDLIVERDQSESTDVTNLGQLLLDQSSDDLNTVKNRIEQLAVGASSSDTKRIGYAAWITADQSVGNALLSASQNKDQLRDFLEAVPTIRNKELLASLYSKIRPFISELPVNLEAELGGALFQQPGIMVDYFYPSASNVAIETLAKMKPKASGIVPQIVIDVPQRKQNDKFALRFTGAILITRSGRYEFFTNSDDGSRLYIGDKLVVNNDGNHGMVEKSGGIDLPAGTHPLIVTYFDNGGGDGLIVSWKGPGFRKQTIAADRLMLAGGESLHDVAIRCVGLIPGNEMQKCRDLIALVKSGVHRASAIHVLRTIPLEHWPKTEIRPLVDNLVGFLSEIPAESRTGSAGMDAMALARSLAPTLSSDRAKWLEGRLANLDVRVIAIGTVPHRMIFDKERIVVQAGKPVEFRFSNSDNMPHNFAITMPGALEEIGLLAESTGNDPDAMDRHYIPDSDKILVGSLLLQPGEDEAIAFDVPSTPGIYPYLCPYPGHWRRMYGALIVVEDLEAYRAAPEKYLAANPLPVKDELLTFNTRGRQWKYDDLIEEVKSISAGRSFEVSKQLFKVSNCVACHKLNNEGQVFGPDLAKLDDKKRTYEHILRSLLEPSKDIDEKYQSQVFELVSGKVVTGMIVDETDDIVKIVIDPVAKDEPNVIPKSDIDFRAKSKVSIMPEGLLDRLSREEILDLVAYIYAGGNEKHMLFQKHNH